MTTSGFPFVVVSLALGILVRCLMYFVPNNLRVSSSIVLFVIGSLLQVINMQANNGCNFGLGCLLGPSVASLEHIEPSVILLVLIPPLLFDSAYTVNFHWLKKTFNQAMLLASLGVVISTVLTAAFCFYAFPYGWSMSESLLLGSILSATDTVAVVSALKQVGASAKLTAVVEGESLFNDATAWVAFLICYKADLNAIERTEQIITLVFGSPLWGLLCALIVYVCLRLVYNDLIVELSLTLLGVYLTFWLGESMEVSSILAAVCFGLFFSYRAKYAYSPEIEESSHGIWSVIAFYGETLIFVLAGVIIVATFWRSQDIVNDPTQWFLMITLYFVLQLIRFSIVFALFPVLNRIGPKISKSEGVIIGYAGLRGVIALALGMLLIRADSENVTYHHFFFHICGIVAVGFMINGTTTEYLHNKLGLSETNQESIRVIKRAARRMDHESDGFINKLRQNWFYKRAHWNRILATVPKIEECLFVQGKRVKEFPNMAVQLLSKQKDGSEENSNKNGGEEAEILKAAHLPKGESQVIVEVDESIHDGELERRISERQFKPVELNAFERRMTKSLAHLNDESHQQMNRMANYSQKESSEYVFNYIVGHYNKQYDEGFLHSHAMALLIHAAESAADFEECHVNGKFVSKVDKEWNDLMKHIKIAPILFKLNKIPVIRYASGLLTYESMCICVEALIGYVNAHYDAIHSLGTFVEWNGLERLKSRMHDNIKVAKIQVVALYKLNPRVLKTIQAVMALSVILRAKRDQVKQLYEEGLLDVNVKKELIANFEREIGRLRDPYRPFWTALKDIDLNGEKN